MCNLLPNDGVAVVPSLPHPACGFCLCCVAFVSLARGPPQPLSTLPQLLTLRSGCILLPGLSEGMVRLCDDGTNFACECSCDSEEERL